jgi:hypothetical protein
MSPHQRWLTAVQWADLSGQGESSVVRVDADPTQFADVFGPCGMHGGQNDSQTGRRGGCQGNGIIDLVVCQGKDDVIVVRAAADARGWSPKIVPVFLRCLKSDRRTQRVWRILLPCKASTIARTSLRATSRKWSWRSAHPSSTRRISLR